MPFCVRLRPQTSLAAEPSLCMLRIKQFYQRWGFEPSPTDELHLFLLMKDIKANLIADPF
jgi:hypothetical protein